MMLRTSRFLLATLLMIGLASTAATTWAACSNPTGEEGAMVYNRDYKTMQFCNGTQWMAMGGVYTVPWQTSGTNVFYNGGDVVVGGQNPSGSKFTVYNATEGWNGLRVNNNSSSGDGIYISNGGSGATGRGLAIHSYSSGYIIDSYWQNGSGWLPRMYLTSAGNLWIAGALTQNSDQRLKKDITRIEYPLDRLKYINGVSFRWRDDREDNERHIGVIAQEVQEAFPELVSKDASGTLSVNYPGLVAPLIEAVKELKAENNTLKHRIERVEEKLSKN
ncbi:tail fiber domain-containing protein [Rhodoplanes sp. SY1]|uniref:tail fiber domain-containing protein n=1 Tax=Rhodoplanes sp. SY1 TaxID=3166646 RepID=UPI0038B46A55